MGHIISMFFSKIYHDEAAKTNAAALEHPGIRIGICPDWRETEKGRPYYFNNILKYYRQLLEKVGGKLVILSFRDDPKDWKGKVDGLIIPGGRDIDPRFYGQENKYSRFNPKDAEKRWNFCKKWVFEADPDMPILGICFGFQVINCLFGGELEQRICNRFAHSQNRLMKLRESSSIAKAVGKLSMRAQCYHQQGIKKMPDWLQPVVWDAEDDTIHGFEYVGDDQRKILGVLWHPEACYEGRTVKNHEQDNFKLLQYFFGLCETYRVSTTKK